MRNTVVGLVSYDYHTLPALKTAQKAFSLTGVRGIREVVYEMEELHPAAPVGTVPRLKRLQLLRYSCGYDLGCYVSADQVATVLGEPLLSRRLGLHETITGVEFEGMETPAHVAVSAHWVKKEDAYPALIHKTIEKHTGGGIGSASGGSSAERAAVGGVNAEEDDDPSMADVDPASGVRVLSIHVDNDPSPIEYFQCANCHALFSTCKQLSTHSCATPREDRGPVRAVDRASEMAAKTICIEALGEDALGSLGLIPIDADEELVECAEGLFTRGWALRPVVAGRKLPSDIRDFLVDLFDQGEDYGRNKATGESAFQALLDAKDDDGMERFDPGDIPDDGTITRLFHTLAAKRKRTDALAAAERIASRRGS